jgi:Fe-S cluster assembly protein SufD
MKSTTAVAESQFAEQFRRSLSSEPDADMRTLRERAFAEFTRTGFPTPANEDWKYTNAAAIVRENWTVARTRSSAFDLSAEHVEKLSHFDIERNGFAALNLAFGELEVVRVAADTSIAEPIIISVSAPAGSAVFPHVLVIVERGAKATIVEMYDSAEAGLVISGTQVFVEDNANLTHYRVQRDSLESYNVGTTEVVLGSGSRYDATSINLGGSLSRHDIDVKFTAEGAECFVDGLYMLSGQQHSDTHSTIDHLVPNCISHQTYKGVLNDSSRAVFNGKVMVRENACGTDAQQSNKNLLLSNDARVDTKPQLEIFNDDVKCSHGATVGQLEEEELFYLLTRGLPETLARNLLTYGFAEEIINKIEIESIKKELDAAVLGRLNTKLDG